MSEDISNNVRPNMSPVAPVQDDGRAQHSRPPEIQPYSGLLDTKGNVIRPIAFKPSPNVNAMSGNSRFSTYGSSDRYGSTPILTRPGSRLTLYGSTSDLHHHTSHVHNNYSLDRKLKSSCLSNNSSSPLVMSSLTSLPHTHSLMNYDSLESVAKSPISNVECSLKNNQQVYHSSESIGGSLLDLTPSPSDSGVSELEAALRDRDSELAYLRQTMEHNEQVIFRVYQEKEKVWDREIRRLKMIHENRLRASAQKAIKLEQMLMMQTYQLNQDKKRLLNEAQRSNNENEKLRNDVINLKSRLEEIEWNLCQKTGEISLLKNQLKESQNDFKIKSQELLQLRTDFKDLQTNIEHCENDCDTLKSRNDQKDIEIEKLKQEILIYKKKYSSTDSINKKLDTSENDRLKAEIKELRDELSEMSLMSDYSDIKPGRILKNQNSDGYVDTLEDIEIQKLIENNNIYNENSESTRLRKELEMKTRQFDLERLTWAHEKEKVLRYQKQLQMNYVQMYRRSKNLEEHIQKLSKELEDSKTVNL